MADDFELRECTMADREDIHAIINDAAEAYRGIIPADRWHEPYMPMIELESEIAAGVRFWVAGEAGELTGVMGIQDVEDVTLIRHVYVRTARQGAGVGRALLAHLLSLAERPVLIGTWADARWAIRFYERNGFRLADDAERDRLLRRYWTIPERQIETSVVLYFERNPPS